MQKITSFPTSQALDEYIHSICPTDAHIHVQTHGVWASDNYNGRFTGLFKETETARCNVVRSFTCHGVTHWTLEKWEHDNGYRCELVILSKASFLDLIHA